MAVPGFYRRVLPSPPAIDFSSNEGKELFVEAIRDGTMEGFYKLIANFQTQSEPAYCGLASLSMVLNALAIDPKIRWKGPWRWFDESMLDCCEPLEKVKAEGICLGKVVCLAQCAGAEVHTFRTIETTMDQFRRLVQNSSVSECCYVISSYHRGTLKQTGTGHFSPIGGYHTGSDLVLMLDVARFKYPPHWVPLTLLWEAMNTTDPQTGQKRGFMTISRPRRERGLLYTLSSENEHWAGIAKYLVEDVPNLLKSEHVQDIQRLISVIFKSLPSEFKKFVHWIVEMWKAEDLGLNTTEEKKGRLALRDEVLKQVEETNLHKDVVNFLSSTACCTRLPSSLNKEENLHCKEADIPGENIGSSGCSGNTKAEHADSNSQGSSPCINMQPAGSTILTMLLLALPRETWSSVRNADLQREIDGLFTIENLPRLLQEEVLHLCRQLYLLKKCQENNVDEDISSPIV